MKEKLSAAILSLLACFLIITGCQPDNTPAENAVPPASAPTSAPAPAPTPAPVQSQPEQPQKTDLTGRSLFIYCGAGMTEPFQKIAAAFEAETGCKLEVTYANAAQIQTQIKTSQEGDMFVAGSQDEVNPIEEFVSGSKALVKHIPVLAVFKGNPLNITGLSDLKNSDVRVFLGDAESTPIGKIANKALTDAGILDEINVVSRTVTAPLISNALAAGECDAAIVWKENCNSDNVEIVDTKDLEPYIKVIPAASLTFNEDTEALAELVSFLDSSTAKDIWTAHGYELAE